MRLACGFGDVVLRDGKVLQQGVEFMMKFLCHSFVATRRQIMNKNLEESWRVSRCVDLRYVTNSRSSVFT